MKTCSPYSKIIHTLTNLHHSHPSYTMGQHLSTALDGSDICSLTDKEILTALKTYSSSLDYDVPHEENIDRIIEGGLHLQRLLLEDEEEEDNEELIN